MFVLLFIDYKKYSHYFVFYVVWYFIESLLQ